MPEPRGVPAGQLLLKERLRAVKHWASLLAPNDGFLIDILVERSMIAGLILMSIAAEIRQSVRWDASWVKLEESPRKLLSDAGLTVKQVCKSEPYEVFGHKVGMGLRFLTRQSPVPCSSTLERRQPRTR